MVEKTYKRKVEDACDQAFVALGYKRPRRGAILLEIDEDFLGWVGLNEGNYTDFLRINPFIGIHCIPVMQMAKELAGEKYKTGHIATYAIHLGELIPDVDAFEFHPVEGEAGIELEAKRLANTVHKHGELYMRKIASYGSLIPLLEERVPMFGGYPERVAAAHYINGNPCAARQFVLERRMNYAEDEDKTCQEHFNKFAEPFLAMLDRNGKIGDSIHS